MLSFVPLALLLVAAFGLVFDDAEVRERVVKTVFENIPLSADERPRSAGGDGQRRAASAPGSIGPFSVLLLIVAGSGVMGALRHTINEAWDIHERPPLLRRKALDLALILGATIVLALLARRHRHPQGGERARRRGGRRPARRRCWTSSATSSRSSSRAA